MKHKFENNQGLGQLLIHLDTEVSQDLLNKVRKVVGVTVCNITTCDKYSITLYKGEMFNWEDIKVSITSLLK